MHAFIFYQILLHVYSRNFIIRRLPDKRCGVVFPNQKEVLDNEKGNYPKSIWPEQFLFILKVKMIFNPKVFRWDFFVFLEQIAGYHQVHSSEKKIDRLINQNNKISSSQIKNVLITIKKSRNCTWILMHLQRGLIIATQRNWLTKWRTSSQLPIILNRSKDFEFSK